MRAIAVYPNEKEIRLIDHPAPATPGPAQVALRMLEVGVCGTDREICAFEYGTPPAGSDYLVLGHEAVGEVVETGRTVEGLERGDLIVPMVRRPCPRPECVPCRGGEQDFCTTGEFTERGITGAHGFLTEIVVDDARYMARVPRGLRDIAVLVEPLTIAEKAIRQLWDIQERLDWSCPHHEAGQAGPGHCHRVVVLGAGPVGMLGAMAFAARDFDVVVYSREPRPGAKAALVESFGGRYVSSGEVAPGALHEALGTIDVIYEATGAAGVSYRAMESLGPNGVFIFTGVPGRKAPIEVDADLLMRNQVLKNQVVFGTVNAGREAFAAAVQDLGTFMTRHPDSVRGLITERRPLEQGRDLLLGRAGGIKNVIQVAA